ncbi:inositol phospholipid synthesis and fat-storage-inducing TM-domain-containing protein [Aspergillus cavernicola]|uniref:Acyl-coenzyme A diphosphatase SCS3 n=1 Tax=Aspergillus cavernicola TaxID=176166 RepID=A0ABR4IGJ9_9EURO
MPPPSTSSTTTPPNTLSRYTPPPTTLLIYPATLLLGSLFSVLSPTAQQSPTPELAQARPINYFARKDNIFNLYFVKIGWVWMTLAFTSLLITYPTSLERGRRQIQAFSRYVLATVVWYATTQWFFGPAIIDRSFVFTGGKCETILRDLGQSQDEKGVLGAAAAGDEPLSVYLTAVACKTAGGAWRGGHDVSGHVFMLVLVTAVLGYEALGVLAQAPSESREEVNGKKSEDTESGGQVRTWALWFVGVVAGLGWWMLLMTAIWFHTWLEKANGLIISLAAVYTIYFLPRRIIPLRNFVGVPGA